MEKKTEETQSLYPVIILVFVLGGVIASFVVLSNLHSLASEVSSMPEEIKVAEPWSLQDSDLYKELNDLEDTVGRKKNDLASLRRKTKNSYYAGSLRSGLENRDMEALMPMAIDSLKNARRNVYGEEDRQSRRDRWEQMMKNMMTDVLELEQGQVEQVWSNLREHRNKREETLEAFADKINKENRKPSEYELQQLEDQLNNMYSEQMLYMKSDLTNQQYNRYQNWLRSGSNRWLEEDERIGNKGEVEMRVVGDKIEVEYEEWDRRRRRRRRSRDED